MADGESNSETIDLNIGGQVFQMLEQTIRSKPETLLCTMLDDPARKEKHGPLFVEADAMRFRYIMDWYRYGSMLLPSSVSVEEMRRECAFYQLPDDVKICRERPTMADAMKMQDAAARAREQMEEARGNFCAAAALLQYFESGRQPGYLHVELDYLKQCCNHALYTHNDIAKVDAAVEALVAKEGCTARPSCLTSKSRTYEVKAAQPAAKVARPG
mmetsp:Transcript_47718/g.87713  ORF Transcript_47718/g.87713 Transcript_47718/m.87713 type:complete len:215 (+) Transcript_47718:54-698(+)